MSYQELIARALKGRSVNKAAKELRIPQRNLDRYTKGESLPDFTTTKVLAMEAGIDIKDAFDALVEEEQRRKLGYNQHPSADVAQLVEQLIRNQ